MGKRKERRLAAKNNAGRRVKLDLFSEPSHGDLGGSSVQEKVEQNMESKHRAGLPNSPSTSGQPENPLLLLGQYSDDDSEVDSDKKLNDTSTGEESSLGNKDEVEVSKGESHVDVEVNDHEVKQHAIDKEIAELDKEIRLAVEDTNTSNINATGTNDDDTVQVSASGACELNGDVRLSWQMVMHEESKQYYYWNVTTGETSWEIPEGFAQEAELSANHQTLETTEVIFPIEVDPNLSSGEMFLDNPSAELAVEKLNSVEWNGGGANEHQHDVNLSNDNVYFESVEASLDENPIKDGSEKLVDSGLGTKDESRIDLSSNLVKYCESLLEKLKSVSKSKNPSLDCISKYNLEVEIRLSDIKTLSALGSSLHHFWAHSEIQLKRLEDSINLEIYKLAQSAVIDDTSQESPELEPEAEPDANGTGNLNSSPYSENIHVSPDTPKDQNGGSPTKSAPIEQANEDDIDMDVDMEVEESPPPPPEEEWVPPLPPDNDLISQPPLPIDLPEPAYVDPPPIPHTEPYNLSYLNPNFVYYTQAGTDVVATGNFYGQVEGYYSNIIPSTHSETPQIVTPVSYYEFQDGVAVPPVPGVSVSETSQFHAEPTLITYGSIVSGDTQSDAILTVEAGCDLKSSAISGEINGTKLEAPVVAATTVEAPVIVSADESVPLPTANPITKGQTKVARSKKRPLAVATTSRTSKKVTSLVNKWKAAKEELLEAEEEPQNAYEMFERKRQKEIEDWRAQQIASGEAKDNANFQPLGGDWRERVKRRRAQKASEAAKTPSEEHIDVDQKRDLTELSKDLPAGWQVYWDESSKQVYYGNVVTSETSWTRPTKMT